MEIHPSAAGEDLPTSDPQSAAVSVAVVDDASDQLENAISAGGKRKREAEEDQTGSAEQTIDAVKDVTGGVDADGRDSQRSSYWKTSLCSYYRRHPQGGAEGCRHGDACRYAHGEAELRPRPDNTWDPTSERAKKLLRSRNGSKVEPSAASAIAKTEVIDMDSLDKCIIGLPKKWTPESLMNFLSDQGVLFKTAKKKKGMTVGFVIFEDTEQLRCAIEVLAEKSIGGKQIKLADANRRLHEKKVGGTMSFDQNKAQNTSGEVCIDNIVMPTSSASDNECDDIEKDESNAEVSLSTRSARDVVTPLADMPYEDQLEQKKSSLIQILKRLTRNARKACPTSLPLPDWINKSREIGALPCKFEGILRSPLTDGYRNKCEFSIGYSTKGEITVGFMAGNFREGITAVEEPINCPNVSRISCEFAMIFQKFLQSSVLDVWDRIENKGFWRQFTVREGRAPSNVTNAESKDNQIGEVMLIIQVCSLNVDEDLMKNEFEKMSEALAHGAATHFPPLPLTTIVVQDHTGISNAAPASCPLIPLLVPKVEGHPCSEKECATEARIHDYISNLCFSISPTAFFQVNTLAAERLYSLAGDWADLGPDTLLFDICCGTGTIGLTLAHRVGMVVGIEMNESAVSDAQRNAVINGIKNCRFVCGKAEDVIGTLLKEYLDVPKQHNNGCSCSLTDSANDDNITDGIADETTVESNSCALTDNLLPRATLAKSSGQELSRGASHGENLADNTKENSVSEFQLNKHADNNFGGAAGAIKSCTTDCGNTTEKSLDGNDLILADCSTKVNEGESPACQFKDIVAIVDPPRVGLHPVVIKALRTHPRIRRLVYISCNPESLVANAIELCTPTAEKTEKAKGNRGWRNMSSAGLARLRVKSMPNSEPFRPVKAIAVDLFPHTPHCELVVLLER